MNYDLIIETVSKELNLPFELVDKTYKAYWKFIRDSIEALPLKEELTEELFSLLRTNFNLPSLGKLVCTFDSMTRIKDRYKNYRKLRHD